MQYSQININFAVQFTFSSYINGLRLLIKFFKNYKGIYKNFELMWFCVYLYNRKRQNMSF